MAEEVKEQKQMSLDSVLKDEKPTIAVPAETPQTPPAQPTEEAKKEAYTTRKKEWRDKEQDAQGRVRDPETGQYAPKKAEEVKEPVKEEIKPEVKPEVKAPVEEYSQREKAAFAKAADETRKRQALERRIAELEAKPKDPEKPFFEDPDGALAKLRGELDRLRTENQNSILITKVQTSEAIARSRYKEDYDEKFAIFNELVQQSPFLAQQAFQSQDPAEFAYQTGKTHKDLRDAGGVDGMKKKLEEDIRAKVKAEIEAELKKKQEDLERERAALPGSIREVPSKGVNRPVWGGPTSLEDIVKR